MTFERVGFATEVLIIDDPFASSLARLYWSCNRASSALTPTYDCVRGTAIAMVVVFRQENFQDLVLYCRIGHDIKNSFDIKKEGKYQKNSFYFQDINFMREFF
jgi:hypothetical protein